MDDEKPSEPYKPGPGRPDRRRRSRHVRPKPLGTWAMMASLAICYGLLKTTGSGDDFLTPMRWIKSNQEIWRGELYRFVSPMFVHMQPMHLVGNLVLFFLFGPQLEVLVGTGRFLWIVFTAGFTGVVASFAFVDEISMGASGAVFGLFGGILAFLVTNRTSVRHLRTKDVALYMMWILILLGLTTVIPNVDNWAHVGGLVGGVCAGLVLVPRLPGLVPKPRLRWAGGLFLIVFLTALIAYGWRWMDAMTQGEYAYMRGDVAAAREAYTRAATMRKKPIPALVGLVKLEIREGHLKEAEQSLIRLRDLVPDHPLVHDQLARLYRDQGRWKDSLVELEALHQFRPDMHWVLPQLGRAYLENGDHRKAVEVLSEYPEHLYDENPITEYYLGDALRRNGQIEKGERYLRAYEDRLRKIATSDKTARSHNNLAWFLFEEGRSLDEALQMALKAVEMDPASQYYLGTLGCVYYQLGRYSDAMKQLEKALERHVSKADAATDLYFASMTALKLGQADIAQKYLKMAEEADPRNRYLAQAKRTVFAPKPVLPVASPSPAASPSPVASPSPK